MLAWINFPVSIFLWGVEYKFVFSLCSWAAWWFFSFLPSLSNLDTAVWRGSLSFWTFLIVPLSRPFEVSYPTHVCVQFHGRRLEATPRQEGNGTEGRASGFSVQTVEVKREGVMLLVFSLVLSTSPLFTNTLIQSSGPKLLLGFTPYVWTSKSGIFRRLW